MENPLDGLVWYVVFLFSTSLHEASHAWAALRGGDPTAYLGGQVSLDPRPHIRREPFGMVFLPLFTAVTSGWPIGFASAPYDPVWAMNHPRRAAWMSLAGPAANLLLVLVASAVIQGGIAAGFFAEPESVSGSAVVVATSGGVASAGAFLVSAFFTLNLILFLFNLMPLPPLDGASVAGLVLPEGAARFVRGLAATPGFSLIGLFVAWSLFPHLADVLFDVIVDLLHPGTYYR